MTKSKPAKLVTTFRLPPATLEKIKVWTGKLGLKSDAELIERAVDLLTNELDAPPVVEAKAQEPVRSRPVQVVTQGENLRRWRESRKPLPRPKDR